MCVQVYNIISRWFNNERRKAGKKHVAQNDKSMDWFVQWKYAAHILHCYVIRNERKVLCRTKRKEREREREREGDEKSEWLNWRKLYTKRYHLWKNRWCRKKEKMSKFRGTEWAWERVRRRPIFIDGNQSMRRKPKKQSTWTGMMEK